MADNRGREGDRQQRQGRRQTTEIGKVAQTAETGKVADNRGREGDRQERQGR